MELCSYIVVKVGGAVLVGKPALILVFIVVKTGFRTYLYYGEGFSGYNADIALAPLYKLLYNNAAVVFKRKLQGGVILAFVMI